jgi:hypothetical protein
MACKEGQEGGEDEVAPTLPKIKKALGKMRKSSASFREGE